MTPDKNEFQCTQLRAGRKLRGMSMQEVVLALEREGINISRQALNKYELGSANPNSESVEALSKILELPMSFFYSKPEITLGEISFRKLENYSRKESDRIEEKVKLKLERYIELEQKLGVVSVFKDPEIGGNISDLESIDKAADKLRKAWDIGSGPIANTRELLENNHIKVLDVRSSVALDGFSTIANEVYPVVVLNQAKLENYPARKRWTTLHELGHILLKIEHLAPKLQERYCHYFAGALLFPRENFFEEIGQSRTKLSLQELGALKQEYGISMQAIVYRAKELKVISESYYRQFFFLFNQMGFKVNEPFKYNGKEASKRFNQLLFRGLAEEVITLKDAADLKGLSVEAFRTKYTYF